MNYDVIRELICSTGYRTISEIVVRSFDLETAYLLSYLSAKEQYFRNQNRLDSDGFFYRTQGDIEEDIYISPYKQKIIIDKLIEVGVIRTKKQGIPCRTWYFIDYQNLMEILSKNIIPINNKELAPKTFGSESPKNSETNFPKNSETRIKKRKILYNDIDIYDSDNNNDLENNDLENNNCPEKSGQDISSKKPSIDLSHVEKTKTTYSFNTQQKTKMYRATPNSFFKHFKNKKWKTSKELSDQLSTYVELRKRLECPIINVQVEGLVRCLEEHSKNDLSTAVEIVKNAIMKGYKGFYPLNGNGNGYNKKNEIEENDFSKYDDVKVTRVYVD